MGPIIQSHTPHHLHIRGRQRAQEPSHLILLARGCGIDRGGALQDLDFQNALLRQVIDVGILVSREDGLPVPHLAVAGGNIPHQALPFGERGRSHVEEPELVAVLGSVDQSGDGFGSSGEEDLSQ